MLHNLIQNAEQALLGHQSPQISIKTTTTPESILITVQDNGPGFTSEVMDRVFDPYFTTKAKGTGLGLEIGRAHV